MALPVSRPKSASSRKARKLLMVSLLAGTALTGSLIYMSTSDADVPRNVRPLDITLLKEKPVYPTRVKDQPELDKMCDLPGSKPAGEEWAGLTRLQGFGGPMVRSMLSYANAASIYTCYYNSPQLASTFQAEAGIVRINKTDLTNMMLQEVHGTLHAYQRNEGKLSHDGSWDLYSRILQKAASEAVAYTGEFVAAMEFQKNGSDELVKALNANGTDGWATFNALYQQTNSLEQAAAGTVMALLQNRDFVSYHADDAIDAYLADFRAGKISKQPGVKFTAKTMEQMGQVPGGLNLARGVPVPNPQTLRDIAPELSRVLDIFTPGKEDADRIAQIAALRNGNTLTVRQALTRIDSRLSGRFEYANRPSIGGVGQYCSQADYKYFQVPAVTKDLWQNMQSIRQGPLMGRALFDFSNDANIYHCYFKMDNAHAGEWYDNDGLVRVSDRRTAPQAAVLTTQAHEIIHGIQRMNNVRSTESSWTIQEYQMMRLAHEAAGRAGQYVLALELKDVGITAPWQDVKIRFPAPAQAAEDAYNRAKSSGLSASGALTAAGMAGWNAQFSDRDWADAYNNGILGDFISMVVTRQAAAPDGKTYPLETARKTGWISKDLNFTAYLPALPAFNTRFGGNVQMRQAFEYVNLEHIAYTTGRNSPRYNAELQRLEKDGNPYLGVDLRVISNTLASPQTTLTALGTMNCFGGVATGCTYGNQPLNPARHKIKMTPGA